MGMYDYCKLKGKMKEKGYTQEAIAEVAGLNPSTFNLKLNGKGLFKQSEITAICNLLGIPPTEIGLYFFTV